MWDAEWAGLRPKLAAFLAGVVLVLVVAGVRFEMKLGGPENIDELYWTGSAYYFDLLAIRGRPMHPDWRLMPARENPPVGKYLIGAALAAGGARIETPDRLALFLLHFADRPGAWGRGESFSKRRQVVDRLSPEGRHATGEPIDRLLPDREVRIGRGLMAALGLLATLGVIALGAMVAGPATGVLAGLLFAAHPITVGSATRIGVDMPAIAFSIAAMLALVALLGRSGRGEVAGGGVGRLSGPAAVLGVALALACGSKMNAAVVLMTTLAVWLALMLDPDPRRRRLRGAVSGALALSAVVFIGSNPALYPDPVAGLVALIRENQVSAGIQAEFLDGALQTVPERIRELAVLVCGRSWRGAVLLALAVALTARAVGRGHPGMIVVCLWWWIAALAVGSWLPFSWSRYALPLLPPTAVIVAAAVVGPARAVAGRLGRGRGRKAESREQNAEKKWLTAAS